MISEIAAARAKARLGLNPYHDWVAKEGLLVHTGVWCDLTTAPTRHWPRYGVNAAAVHLAGNGDFCNLFVLELGPAAATEPQQHLYEEVIYVIEGRGSTQLEFPDGRKRSFEWQPRSLFAIPLNAKHRHFNADGRARAVLATTTTLPLMLKVFHNERFLFENDGVFDDRIGRDGYFSGDGDLSLVRPGMNIWETNFVPDVAKIELTPWNERGAGSRYLQFILAEGGMHAHCSEIQPGTYKKAHRHLSGRLVFIVTGKGYSLLWYDGQTEFDRVDWKPGIVFPPIERQFHQHFVTSPEPSRYLATGMSNARYPFTEAMRKVGSADDGTAGLNSISVKQGGNQIEYADQDPRIHALWLEAMRENGITPQFDRYVTPA